MRRKVSTLLDDALYRRAKLEAAAKGKQISEILGEALEQYLATRGEGRGLGIVAETWSTLEVPAAELEEIMAEDGWLDA